MFNKLDNALNEASLGVALENNAMLKEKLMYTKAGQLEYKKIPRDNTHDEGGCCMMDIDEDLPTTIRPDEYLPTPICPDSTSVRDKIKKAVEDEFVTTACFHGFPLPKEKINSLRIDPELVHSISGPQPNGDADPQKVI